MVSYCICLSLTYFDFSMTISGSIHVAANGIISFFFCWLSNIPLYSCTICSSSIPVNGHIGFFHVLPIVNSVTMNISILFKLKFCLHICPGMGLLDHMIALCSLYLLHQQAALQSLLSVSPPGYPTCKRDLDKREWLREKLTAQGSDWCHHPWGVVWRVSTDLWFHPQCSSRISCLPYSRSPQDTEVTWIESLFEQESGGTSRSE